MFPKSPFLERFTRLNSHFSVLWVWGTKANQGIWAGGFLLMDVNCWQSFPFIETGLTYCLQSLLTFIGETLSPQISPSVSPTTTYQIHHKQVHLTEGCGTAAGVHMPAALTSWVTSRPILPVRSHPYPSIPPLPSLNLPDPIRVTEQNECKPVAHDWLVLILSDIH